MNASRHFYAIASLVTILTAVSVSSTHHTVAAGFANPAPVLVTNTSGSPVPTTAQGTTQVGGTVAVSNLPATQAVSGSVAVNNFPSSQNVAVSNFPSTQNVAVTGTADVSGTVAVSNFPSTQSVSVSGTPSVNVSSLPAVQMADGSSIAINNTSGNPIPVTNVGDSHRERFHVAGQISMPAGVAFNTNPVYTVPIGKTFVVEDIIVAASDVTAGTKDTINVVSPDTNFPIPMQYQGNFQGAEFYDGAMNGTDISFTGGTQISLFLHRSDSTASGVGGMILYGYLEDAP